MASTTSGIPQEIHDKATAGRLRLFREQYIDKSQTQAAVKLKIPQSALSYMESAKAPIRFEFISKLVKEYKLNQDWITSGNGKPTDKNPPKNGLLIDINAINVELNILKKHLKIMELNQNHMLGLVERQAKKIEDLEMRLESK